jgi:hypothetical protein
VKSRIEIGKSQIGKWWSGEGIRLLMMGLASAFLMTSGKTLSETAEIFASVAKQLMSGEQVVVSDEKAGDQKIRVKRIGSGRLRMVQFRLNGKMVEAIEQNPEKPSRWGQLARENHQVVQFMDADTHKYVAVSVDGKVREYAHMGEDY